jgi:hypothetical protein
VDRFDAGQQAAEQGYIKYFTYQPAGRHWHFQLIEGGWLLALSIVLAAATVWLIRHRATQHCCWRSRSVCDVARGSPMGHWLICAHDLRRPPRPRS